MLFLSLFINNTDSLRSHIHESETNYFKNLTQIKESCVLLFRYAVCTILTAAWLISEYSKKIRFFITVNLFNQSLLFVKLIYEVELETHFKIVFILYSLPLSFFVTAQISKEKLFKKA